MGHWILKPLPNNPGYYASEEGYIYSDKNGYLKVLKPTISNKGYYMVNIDGKTRNLHRLIAESFLSNFQDNLQVNHINGIKTDNRLENLEMVTNRQNRDHAINLGTVNNKGSRNGMAKLTEEQVYLIRYKYKGLYKVNKLAEMFNVTRHCISEIQANRTWRHI